MLARRVDGASLGMFRILFGSVMAWEAYDFVWPLFGTNRIKLNYYNVNWNVPFPFFEWLTPWPAPWLHVQCLVMGLAAVSLAVGFYSRLSALVVFLTWTHLYLLDAAWYNNHYYLASIFALLLAVMPCDARYSVDRRMRQGRDSSRTETSATIPFAAVFVLRAQLFIVYFYGALTKINTDWLLEAQPVQKMLAKPTVGTSLTWLLSPAAVEELQQFLQTTATAHFFARTGLLFDLLVGFLLIIRRTRIFGLALMITFHAMNHVVLFEDIGVFPALGIASALIFLDPDWPRRFGAWLARPTIVAPHWGWLAAGVVGLPVIGLLCGSVLVPEGASTNPALGWVVVVGIALALTGATLGWNLSPSAATAKAPTGSLPRWVTAAVSAWLVVQIVVPFRHLVIAGDWRWTNEARFWSWTMKTASFDVDRFRLHVTDPKLFDTDEGGNLVLAQKWLSDDDFVYREIDAQAIDWRRLPELMVTYEPVCGHRVIYNPWSGRDSPMSPREARDRIQTIWQETYGRNPEIVLAIPLSTVLESAEYAMSERERVALAEPLRVAREATNSFAPGLAKEADRDQESNDLYMSWRHLALTPAAGGRIGNFLRQAKPFATAGAADVDGAFFIVNDPQLIKVGRGGFGMIDRQRWKSAWPDARYVYVDLNRLKYEWQVLPRVMLVQGEQLQPGAVWNPFVDLSRMQVMKVASTAPMLHQYAHHVADLWQSRFGNRPEVRAHSYISLNQHPKQLLADPTVDLAAVPWRHLSHNEWIMPLETERKRTSFSTDD